MKKKNTKVKLLLILISLFSVIFVYADYSGNLGNKIEYKSGSSANVSDYVPKGEEVELRYSTSTEATTTATTTAINSTDIKKELGPVNHIKTPEVVKAFYMTSCIASGAGLRSPLTKMIDRTQINSIVIDVKDYTGYISVDFNNPNYPIGGKSCLVKDMREFLAELGSKGVYRIARIAVMQDPYYAEKHPDQAVKRKDNGGVWKDKKGLAFVDPASTPFWEYNRDIAYDAYSIGFDEVNFDYVRYPTDGSLSNMSFNLKASSTKESTMKKF